MSSAQMPMNIGLLSISVIGAVFGIVTLGLGAYNASVLQQTFKSGLALGLGAWWGGFPTLLASGLGLATALMPTTVENPGYGLAVATAIVSFGVFILCIANAFVVGILVILLFTVTKSSNNDDSVIRGVRRTFQVYAASEAFLVLSAIIVFILFIYTAILTCTSCCGTQCDCCGCEGQPQGQGMGPAGPGCNDCAECGECTPAKPPAPSTVQFGVAPRPLSMGAPPMLAAPALPQGWISQVQPMTSFVVIVPRYHLIHLTRFPLTCVASAPLFLSSQLDPATGKTFYIFTPTGTTQVP